MRNRGPIKRTNLPKEHDNACSSEPVKELFQGWFGILSVWLHFQDNLQNLTGMSFASFDHSLSKYFSSTYYVPGTVLDAGNIGVNKKGKNFCLLGASFLMGK